jgi:hypothetical protein
LPVAGAGYTQGTPEGLEECFDFVMAGAPIHDSRMYICARATGKAFEEVIHQLRLQVSNPDGSHLGLNDRHCATSKIYCRESQRFIHGHEEITGSQDAAPVTERAIESFPESDSDVLDGVVLIDIEIAASHDFQVESAVTREEFEHVIEETDSGGNVVFSPTLNGKGELNIGFGRFAVKFRFSHSHTRTPLRWVVPLRN